MGGGLGRGAREPEGSPCRVGEPFERVAVLMGGFIEKANGDFAHALKLARKHGDIHEKSHGSSRPFEDALAMFIPTALPRIDATSVNGVEYADEDVYKVISDNALSHTRKVIKENTMLFADLCPSAIPEPLVVHGGFHRGTLVDARVPDAGCNVLYGNLLHATAAQLYAYLNDGFPWRICKVCGRPFKHEQQLMSPITSEQAIQKEYAHPHRETKTSFCSKRHEKQVYSKRNAKIRVRKEAREKEHEKKGAQSV